MAILTRLSSALWTITDLMQQYNGAVTAVATVAIGMLSYFLVKVTNRQARLTRESIDLTRKEFVATHRPKLRVRLFRAYPFDVRQPLTVEHEIVNIGDTEAHVVGYELTVQTFASQGGGTRLHKTTDISFDRDITGGENRLAVRETDIMYDGNWGTAFSIDVAGKITYRDANGAIRRTSFYRRYKSSANRFETLPDPDYEYED